jgi:hypothetical protein
MGERIREKPEIHPRPRRAATMYLARKRINNHQFHFFIRHSFAGPKYMLSRDLFDLGADPTRFIHYPGGKSCYIDPCIEEALKEQGLDVNQNDLEALFFEFLAPETQRLITGFDRGYKHGRKASVAIALVSPHLFDKRRYYYLRFGSRKQQHIHQVAEKVFQFLLNKSRDEIEQYFFAAERILRPHENFNYITTIFELGHFVPDSSSDLPPVAQLDTLFMDRLCSLNIDSNFMAGVHQDQGLYEHLIKYVIMYFDATAPNRSWENAYSEDFINRHRIYKPPPMIRIKIQEAEQLFGQSWKELELMDRRALTRKYRQLAKKYHPDQGGQGDAFLRLTAYFQALLRKKK